MTKIYLDAGHGGSDSGAVGNGLKEKDLTLKLVLKMKELLSNYQVDVKLSRESDKTLSLPERTNDANKWGADYLVSVHINAGGGEGYEDFIYEKLDAKSQSSKLRNIMHSEIVPQMDMKNRGKKKANFHMLRESNMASILTESGFIDNVGDAKKLKSDAYLNKVALGHVNGLVKAFELKPKKEQPKKEQPKQVYVKHTVKMGETLYKISSRYNVLISDIMKANPKIENPNKIFTGTILNIPKK